MALLVYTKIVGECGAGRQCPRDWRIVALEVNGTEVCISIIDGCGIKHQNELPTAFVN